MKHPWRIAILLAVFAYLTAASRYWRWGGIPRLLQEYACPLCPNVDSVGGNVEKFAQRTIGMGTVRAIVLLSIFGASYLLVWLKSRRSKKSSIATSK